MRSDPSAEIDSEVGRLHSSEARYSERFKSFKRLMSYDAMNVDLIARYPSIVAFPPSLDENMVSYIRLLGIFHEKYVTRYTEMGQKNNFIENYTRMYESCNDQCKGIITKQIGRMLTPDNIDSLSAVITRSAGANDSYVRKAAALAILDAFHVSSSYLEKYKFKDLLIRLTEDSNPNVASNALSVLNEINMVSDVPIHIPTFNTINNLLASMDNATEWGQIQILDFVCTYQPSHGDAKDLITRIQYRLSHANSAVVLAAARCCIHLMNFIDDPSVRQEAINKITLPLITLLGNSHYEIQYIALKSLLNLLMTRERINVNEVNIFFCKYDDPLYIKLVKLDIVLLLATQNNSQKVLDELWDCSKQSDVQFVRKAISSIGKIAVKFEASSQLCVNKISDLLKTESTAEDRPAHVVEECLIAASMIFRKYGTRFLRLIEPLYESIDGPLKNHAANAAFIWILGEYCDRIDEVDSLLEEFFFDSLNLYSPDVQLAFLTAVTKFYLKNNDNKLLQSTLEKISEFDNPDVRDRAFMYYNLVNAGIENVEQVVISQDQIIPETDLIDYKRETAQKVLPYIGTIAVAYDKPPSEFVQQRRIISMDTVNYGEVLDIPVVVAHNGGYPLEIRALLQEVQSKSSFLFKVTNYSSDFPLNITDIRIKNNVYGYNMLPGSFQKIFIPPEQTKTVTIPLDYDPNQLVNAEVKEDTFDKLFVAVLTGLEGGGQPQTVIFSVDIRLESILSVDGRVEKEQFQSLWGSIQNYETVSCSLQNPRIDSLNLAKSRLAQSRVFFAGKKDPTAYFSGRTVGGEQFVIFIEFSSGSVQIGIKMSNTIMANIIIKLLQRIIQ